MSVQRAVPERVAWRVGAAAAAALAVLAGCTTASDEETTPSAPPNAEASPATSSGPNTAGTIPQATATTDDESSTDAAPVPTAARAAELVFGEPSSRRVSPVGESWIDPELLALADDPLIAWQEPSGAVRVASLDTDTGDVVDGSSRLIATDAAALRGTFNGPEFGLDSDGWSVAYTRVGADGTEIAVARPSSAESGFDVEPIPADRPRFSPLASRVPDGPMHRPRRDHRTGRCVLPRVGELRALRLR